ncbi:gamma-glutamyltransferase [Sciscionella sediminilitoris]|uniref:gamma-glutamyltransferase n=1 Tax=Sciscionella sediminilitoris TaxID=1445613 RepID=UPI0004DF2F33|nr:gamma-glutamyltransferase [Sciscionella sp. SE31]
MAVLVACERHAAEVGGQLLRAGGSAVDAAVGAAFAQAVVNPLLCGLGGSALVLHADLRTGTVTAINGEAATGSGPVPGSWARRLLGRVETFGRYAVRGEPNQIGPGAVMVPGFVDAMDALLAGHGSGRIGLDGILAGATRLAREGFVLTPYLGRWWDAGSAGDSHASRPGYPTLADKMAAQPESAARYLRADGSGYRAGDRFAQPWIADILDHLATAGLPDFLHGSLGAILAAALERDGSLITAEDVAGYRAEPAPATTHRIAGNSLHTAPPPSPGLQVLQMLGLAHGLRLAGEPRGPHRWDRLAAVMRASFADNRYIKATRQQDIADTVRAALDADALGAWVERIRGGDPVRVRGAQPGDGTTHVTAVDSEHAVCITHSAGSVGGSGYLVPELGYLLNNFLGHYDPRPEQPDSIRPGARIGTGAPLIAFDGNGFRFAAGAPGGSRLVTSVFQVAHEVLFGGTATDTAVTLPRLHSEQDRTVLVEPALDGAEELRALGNDVRVSGYMSRVQAIGRDRSGRLVPGADPRGDPGLARTG